MAKPGPKRYCGCAKQEQVEQPRAPPSKSSLITNLESKSDKSIDHKASSQPQSALILKGTA